MHGRFELIPRHNTVLAASASFAVAVRPSLIYFFGAREGLVFGYDTGVMTATLLFIKSDMALSPAMEGLIVSSLLAGAIIVAVATIKDPRRSL